MRPRTTDGAPPGPPRSARSCRRCRVRRYCATRRQDSRMPGGDTTAPASQGRRAPASRSTSAVDALAVSELSHVTEEARVFMALGHNDRAIEVLHEHIKRLPRSMPAAWLMLLDLYHASGNRPEFRRLAEDFHAHFNVQTPLWEAFASEERRRRRHRRLSAHRAAGGGALAQARMPRLPGATPLRQSRGAPQWISAVDLRRHPAAAAGAGRAGRHRHRRGSGRRRQARRGPRAAPAHAAPRDGPITTTGELENRCRPTPRPRARYSSRSVSRSSAPDSGDKKKS